MDGYFKDDVIMKINDLIENNKQLSGLTANKARHEVAIKQISDLIKDIAGSREPIMEIVGGNMIRKKPAKEAIKILHDRKKEIDIGITSMEEQIRVLNDSLNTKIIGIYKVFKSCINKDILKDIDKGE